MEPKMRRWMPLAMFLGILWNGAVLPIVASGPGMPWYVGLGVGLLLGAPAVLIGEGILRPIDRRLFAEHGLMACLSPSFLLRVCCSLVPGYIARVAASDEPKASRQSFAGSVVAHQDCIFDGEVSSAGHVLLQIDTRGRIDRRGTPWGTVDSDGDVSSFAGQIGRIRFEEFVLEGNKIGDLHRR